MGSCGPRNLLEGVGSTLLGLHCIAGIMALAFANATSAETWRGLTVA